MMYQKMQARISGVVHTTAFEVFIIIVIVISAMGIGAETFALSPEFRDVMGVFDYGISLFFLIEISFRFLAEKNKAQFFKSGWNIFDLTIVVVSLMPLEYSHIAIVGRLIRVFRVLRLISVVPELRVLITSLFKAMPQFGYVLLLMFIIYYIYGAIGNFLFRDINPELWGNITLCMLTLFRIMTLEDWTDILYETMEVSPYSWVFFLSFIFLTTFVFLNMVIGIIVSVMEEERMKRNEVSLLDQQKDMAHLITVISALKTEVAALKSHVRAAVPEENKPL